MADDQLTSIAPVSEPITRIKTLSKPIIDVIGLPPKRFLPPAFTILVLLFIQHQDNMYDDVQNKLYLCICGRRS